MNRSQHYIVAGGGIAGITAAIELAASGHAVTLYEQAKDLGGRAATRHQHGYALNLGPHALYRGGVLNTQLHRWGIALRGAVPVPDGRHYLVASGERYLTPRGSTGLLRNRAFTWTDRFRIARILASIHRASALPAESAETWIRRRTPGARVRHLLSALFRVSTFSADLDLLDAASALRQLRLAIRSSVLYLDGGWESLVHALAAKAASLGVDIRTGIGIASVQPGEALLDDGTRVAAAGIVLAVPPNAVEQLASRQLPQRTPARVACLDLALRRRPARAATFALGLDQPLYASIHSNYAAGLAPEGGALVQLAMYLRRDMSCTREQLEHLADLALPGWRDEVVYARFLPHLDVVHAIPCAAAPRPSVDALRLPGIRIAGDWVGDEAMLSDAACASALLAARQLASAAYGKAA